MADKQRLRYRSHRADPDSGHHYRVGGRLGPRGGLPAPDPVGRETYALGANPVAARLALVRSTWTLVVAFCISALCAAMVGVFFAGYSGIPDPTVGVPYFFLTITAVLIGGTSLLGGRGGYQRTVMGALIVAEL